MVIYEGNCVCAVGVLVRRVVSRHPGVQSRTWVLNATGSPNFDQIFIEYNGLLARPEAQSRAWGIWADNFIHQHQDWDEVQLRGISTSVLNSWQNPSLQLKQDMLLVGRYVDLDAVRRAAIPFIETLSKKKRARVRYTQSIYQKYGPLRIEVAGDKTQALAYLEELKALHQKRWQGRHEHGAFSYPFFEIFHSKLIDEHFDDGVIQLLRVRAGEQTVGMLYNFVYGGDVIVYQTGFNYDLVEARNKESPGLLTHVLAIDYNLRQGHRRYDLLAGDSEYKRALAHNVEQLWWGRVQRRRLKFRAEDNLKAAWRLLAHRLRPSR